MEPLPLSHEDRAILELEGPHVVGHTCKVVVVEPPVPSLAELRSQIASRIQDAPLLLRRLGREANDPVWLQQDTLDIASHVGESEPVVDAKAFRNRVAFLFAQHLDRDKPLWRLDTIPLPDGSLALAWRIHHSLADGTTAMRLGETVLWTPSKAGERHAGQPAGAGGHEASDARRRGHLGGFLRREFAESLHRSPFDGEVGARRSVAFASADFDILHNGARRAAGATVNEAVLSVVAGALRRWLLHHHGDLGPIRLRVPVSLHHEGDDPGNHDSFFTLPVSLHEPDPVARLREIHAASAARKQEHDAEQLESLLDSLDAVSPRLRAVAEHLQSGPRSFALAVSNVPGPREPIAVCGAPVRSLHSLAEVGRRHGLRITAVSMAGRLGFGVTADPGIAPDVGEIATGIETEAAALAASA